MPFLSGHQRAFGDAVVVPLPGLLLTNSLFSCGSSIGNALSTAAVDSTLGEEAVLSACSLPAAAQLIVQGLDQRHGKNVRAILVGHSYGGYAALELAKHWPARLAGLILVSTQVRADTPGVKIRRQQQIELLRREGLEALLDRLMPALLACSSLADPDLTESLRTMVRHVGADTFERQVLSSAARADHRATLRDLPPDIPVLLVSGKEDRVTPPRCLQEMRDLLTQREQNYASWQGINANGVAPWRSVSYASSGHLVPLEQPVSFRDSLEQWSEEVRGTRTSVASGVLYRLSARRSQKPEVTESTPFCPAHSFN